MFLSDIAKFALPKSYLTRGTPVYRGVARRLHVRRVRGANGLSKLASVSPSTAIRATTSLRPKTVKANPMKSKF